MESIKDFFEEVKIRLANPLLGSFIFAWLFINYPIPITLLFYKQTDLKLDGYDSYLDVITKHSAWYYIYALPLAVAVIYTFGFPHVRALIHKYHAKITTKNEHEVLEISRSGSMPMGKYLQLKENYDKKTVDLKSILDNESAIIDENTSLIHQKNLMNLDINKLTEEKNRLIDHDARNSRANKVEVLNGDWLYSSKTMKNRWKILDNTIEVISGPDEGKFYRIEDYFAYPPRSRYVFTCRIVDPNIPYKLDIYIFSERDGRFQGKLNGEHDFTLGKDDGSAWKI